MCSTVLDLLGEVTAKTTFFSFSIIVCLSFIHYHLTLVQRLQICVIYFTSV